MQVIINETKKYLVELQKTFSHNFWREYILLFFIGFVLTVPLLSNFNISIDDEYSAFRTSHSIWIDDGRFTTALIEKFLFGVPVVPFLPNVIFTTLISFSYILMRKIYGIKKSFKTYFLFPIFVVFPTWWFIVEFYANLPSAIIGTFLTFLSIFIFSVYESKKESQTTFNPFTIMIYFLCGLIFAFAIGTYQAMIPMYLTVILGNLFFCLLNKDAIKNNLLFFSKTIIVMFLGIVIYFCISKIFQLMYPSGNKPFISGYLNTEALFKNPKEVYDNIYREMDLYYSFSADKYGMKIKSLAVLLPLSLILITLKIILKKIKKGALIILTFLFLLFSPFAINLIAAHSMLPTRSLLSLSVVFWIMSYFIISFFKQKMLLLPIMILLGWTQFQIINLNSQYAAATYFSLEHDKIMASSIYQLLGQADPNFDRSKTTYINFYGIKSLQSHYPNPFSSTMHASFFDWDLGNPSRMLSFMKLMGYENLTPLSDAKREEYYHYFKDMPAWPAQNSVKMVGENIFLIKLSDQPDLFHRKIEEEINNAKEN